MLGKALSYAQAYARWIAAGSPVRVNDEIRRIFEGICRQCPHFQQKPRKRGGKCGLCGCGLNLNSAKIAWATEHCPDTPPRWYATAGPQKPPQAAQESVPERKMPTKHERKQERIAARQARVEARQSRIKARQDRKARRAQKKAERLAMGGEEPPLVPVVPVEDPLKVYDRYGNPGGHFFRGWWSNCAAFLVGGGPSLKQLDLGFLRERGVASLGINNVAGYAPVKAMTFSDPPEKFHHGVLFDPTIIKFVPLPCITKHKRVRAKKPDGTFQWTAYTVEHCPAVVGFERDGIWDPPNFLKREMATWGISQKHPENKIKFPDKTMLFTFFIGLRLLHYLGVRRVYLLGVDFGMSDTKGYAFDQYRWKGAIRGNNNTYVWASAMLAELRPHLDAAGFQVFQTNRDSYLKVFDYVPLETAIADCRGVVPQEPLDMQGWYEKRNADASPMKMDASEDDRGE